MKVQIVQTDEEHIDGYEKVKIDNGKIKTRGCIAIFLLPKVDAGQAACVREKGLK